MPLEKSKSKKAFEKNIKTEDKALKAKGVPKGKADKQAVAIAYSEKKDAEKRDRKEDKKKK